MAHYKNTEQHLEWFSCLFCCYTCLQQMRLYLWKQHEHFVMGVSSLSGTNTIKAFFIFQISFGRQDGGEDTFFLCLRCFNTGRIHNKVLTSLPFLFLEFPGFKDKISKSEVAIQWGIRCFTKRGTLKSENNNMATHEELLLQYFQCSSYQFHIIKICMLTYIKMISSPMMTPAFKILSLKTRNQRNNNYNFESNSCLRICCL